MKKKKTPYIPSSCEPIVRRCHLFVRKHQKRPSCLHLAKQISARTAPYSASPPLTNNTDNAPKIQGRVVLRGDIVKDDSGSYAVFTEQGSSVSQMTAAKVMDIISRLPGCAGQAADAVSSETQVKLEDAPKVLKIPKSECPDIWIRLPRHTWPKSWSNMEDPVVPLERNQKSHPLAGLLLERQFEKILLQHGWEKVSN